MALLQFLFNAALGGSTGLPTQIGLITLDVTIEETHERRAEPTDFPIEGGSSISDHVRLQPNKLTVSGFITDTPLLLNDLGLQGIGLGRARAATAFQLLESMFEARLPFTVVSQLRVYQNMVIESLSVPKTRESALRFRVTMQELKLVSGQNVLIPASASEAAKSAQSSGGGGAGGGGAGSLGAGNVSNAARDSLGLDAGRQVATIAPSAAAEKGSLLHSWLYGDGSRGEPGLVTITGGPQ
jgi:hypothetical protein